MKGLMIKLAKRMARESPRIADAEEIRKQYNMPGTRKFVIQFKDEPSVLLYFSMQNGKIEMSESPLKWDIRIVSTTYRLLQALDGDVSIDQLFAYEQIEVFPRDDTVDFGQYDLDVARIIFKSFQDQIRRMLRN